MTYQGKLPEDTEYRDTGCEASKRCLTCPFPRCRYDTPRGLRALLEGIRIEKGRWPEPQGYIKNVRTWPKLGRMA